MRLKVNIFILGMAVVFCSFSQSFGQGLDDFDVRGLWRLMGVMPAGVPSEEVPDRLDGYLCYWFHGDGTVTMMTESRDGRDRQAGMWKQKGRTVLIVWESGMRQSVQIIRNEGNSLFLTGFGARPLWFRFTRMF